MKGFVIFLACVVWLWLLYYGYTLIVTKTLKSAPVQEKSTDLTRKEAEQRQRRQDSLKQQRQLIQDRQRTLRNYQNR
jgi:hypothetical protein